MKVPSSSWHPLRWVYELTQVWRDTRQIVLVAQIAAIYAAILIPFKVGIPLIPGFGELRHANAIPIVTHCFLGLHRRGLHPLMEQSLPKVLPQPSLTLLCVSKLDKLGSGIPQIYNNSE